MMNNHFPWDSITVPRADLNLRRIDDNHYHDFSWGKDAAGKQLLVLALPGLNAEELKKRKLDFNGIKSDIRQLNESGDIYFQLTLQSTDNTDIFYKLCIDLTEKTRTVPDLKSALSEIYRRLEVWRRFLSKSTKSTLSFQEIQGLFAELSFLEECIDGKHITAEAALEGWQGPLDAPHDFIFGPEAVEIKSLSGSSIEGVRISSEEQLTSHLDHLYLHIIFLIQDFDCATGISLNSLVRQIRDKLTGELLTIFDNRLFASGYIDIPEYDRPNFSISQARTYEVLENFPRLIPDNIPNGISDVSYFIRFNSIEQFLKTDFKPGRGDW